MSRSNPCRWPSILNLGQAFADALVDRHAEAGQPLSAEGLARLRRWLDAPCCTTVKLDGSNMGIDQDTMWGRNTDVPKGERYQKTPVWEILDGYLEKAAGVRSDLERAAGSPFEQVVVYGECVASGRYDYQAAGVLKKWLGFGVAIRTRGDADQCAAVAGKLREGGFNSNVSEDKVLIAPNEQLFELFGRHGIAAVSEYRPSAVAEEQWRSHDGGSPLPRFRSLRCLLTSEWLARFFHADDGPLGEGLVVASLADGTLFKLKHGGEEQGSTPEKLRMAIDAIGASGGGGDALAGLLEVFEALQRIALLTPKPGGKQQQKGQPSARGADAECERAWASALTKEDSLDDQFRRGQKGELQQRMVAQVKDDLQKDFGVPPKQAEQRARKFVQATLGRMFGEWKKGAGEDTRDDGRKTA